MVGTPIANRTRSEVEGLIGFFVNTLALRGRSVGRSELLELLGRVREAALGAYAHQDLPFEKLVDALARSAASATRPSFRWCLRCRMPPGIGSGAICRRAARRRRRDRQVRMQLA